MCQYASLDELEREIVGCRICPRLVAWREKVGAVKRKAYQDQTYWAKPVQGLGMKTQKCWWWDWRRVLMDPIVPDECSPEMIREISFIMRFIEPDSPTNQPPSQKKTVWRWTVSS